MTERFEDGRCEPHDQRDGAEQAEPHDERERDAYALCALPVRRGQLVGQDGNEDQVVDAEHDFHDDERCERGPGGGIGEKGDEIVHGPGNDSTGEGEILA